MFYSQIQVADALSHALPHFCWQEFWHLVPDTQPLPISIPQNSWQIDIFTLEQQCYSFLNQGPAPSIWRLYASVQAQFISN